MARGLNEVSVGVKTKVTSISRESNVRRRLMDMGIVPGIQIQVSGKAPLGDPIEILIRGYKLTLRKAEAMSITVE
ncbi:ferrous iron transport protein A [Clostridium sp. MB40-C1]|uniref:FeoA family protein n=1 Tax=Clostridium sp. MB40-C1 TaxID=3070996 RepID=UPI0027E0A82A|nr:ferrous iron transport protein A [Clostridium sp. MB40-C1]WMJ79445.1 ferrous iron transport protein A [Clostridium sp. MB40-C1]